MARKNENGRKGHKQRLGPAREAQAVCRGCALEQKATGWYHSAKPRCAACGGLLDKLWLNVGRGRYIPNPQAREVRPCS